jgi:hypothetical protein
MSPRSSRHAAILDNIPIMTIILTARSQSWGAVMARSGTRSGRGARQWRRGSQACADCASLSAVERREAQRPTSLGARVARSQGRPKGRHSTTALAPPGAPFPVGGNGKREQACLAPSDTRGGGALANPLTSFRDASEASGPGIHTPQRWGYGFRARGLTTAPRNDGENDFRRRARHKKASPRKPTAAGLRGLVAFWRRISYSCETGGSRSSAQDSLGFG